MTRWTFIPFLIACSWMQSTVAEDYSSELPRIEPTQPDQAVSTFRVAEGFRIELVAAEPLLGSPVAIEWDADGRMFVCEMRGYSENRNDALSTIGLLTDVDGDGIYDSRVTYADELLWPTAIFPFDGGLFVADAPDIYYLKDTDGDGKADQKRIVLSGFSTSNVQGLLNSFRWGLDNRIHVACSSTGGNIRRPDGDEKPINVRGRDLSFDPKTFHFTPTSGGAQHGMCFDDWGRKFVSSNSDHIQQVMYEDHFVARNGQIRPPRARLSIAADGPQAEVYRASAVEPWRIVRTRLRVAGTVRGPVEGGGRAAGYFTGATGITIYRGDAWPETWKGLAIVGDVGSNLIHRKKLTPNGLSLIANRIDKESEFVTSSDIWFRPAQFANAPDGSLHVIDVYREVIEHPKSLPPDIKKHLDLTSGRDRGRIYRIVPTDYQHRRTESLTKASTVELASLLTHPNAWHRETAARLIFQRNDPSIAPKLRDIATNSGSELGRLHSMYALDGLGELDSDTLLARLVDSNPQVRRHAVRLAAKSKKKQLAKRLLSQTADSSLSVRYELAFALGETVLPETAGALAELIRQNPTDRWMHLAVQSSCAKLAGELFVLLAADDAFWEQGGADFLAKLTSQIIADNKPDEVQSALAALAGLSPKAQTRAMSVIGPFILAKSKKGSVVSKLSETNEFDSINRIAQSSIQESIKRALDESLTTSLRVEAIRSTRLADDNQAVDPLCRLIDLDQPHEVQREAMIELGRRNDPKIAVTLTKAWPTFSPSLRSTAEEVLFARQDRALALLMAATTGAIKATSLTRSRLRVAAQSKSAELAEKASALLSASSSQGRAEVLKKYEAALTMPADRERGKAAFKKHCSVCHRVEGVGYELGPNLAAMKARGPAAILNNVLDPNREVNPQYVNYQVLTSDGRMMTGMIVAESAGSMTLVRAEGAKETVLRGEIERLQSSGVSLMPEELEKAIDVQAMADLIDYLMHAK